MDYFVVPCGAPDCDGECARCLYIKRIRDVPFGGPWRQVEHHPA